MSILDLPSNPQPDRPIPAPVPPGPAGTAALHIPALVWIAWVATFAVFWSVLPPWVRDWIDDPNYSHGFLVPVITLYLGRKAVLEPQSRRSEIPAGWRLWIGPAMCVVGLLGYLLGTAGSELFTMRVGFVLTLLGSTWWLGGAHLGAALTAPILFLFFSIPLPAVLYTSIALTLQRIVAILGVHTLTLIGIPAVREGNILQLPGAALEVAEACSGIRSLTVLLAIGTIWAYQSRRKPVRAIILFAATVPLVIIGNTLRILLTAVGTQVFGPSIAGGAAHEGLGIVVFLAMILGLLGLSWLLSRNE